MPPIKPNKPVGTLSSGGSMRVVICSSCMKKRWAIKMKDPYKVRTTCCGKEMQV